MLLPVTFVCGYCWQANETTVDASQGASQRYVEDCQVCCRPMVLHIHIDGDGDDATATADAEPE